MDANALSDVQCGMRTAKACGPGAPVAGANPGSRARGDGDTKAGLTGARTI
jgi:hypothetical protein